MNTTASNQLGKLQFFSGRKRLITICSELVELFARFAPRQTVSIEAAEVFLTEFCYQSGNNDRRRLRIIADQLFFAFPCLTESEAYQLLLSHSDSAGQCLPFSEVRRVTAPRWGALTR